MEWIAFAVVAALGFVAVVLYNRLVSLRQSVKQAQADVEAVLMQRADLVPNLVATVKAYAAHESSTLSDLNHARARTAHANNRAEASEADGMMGRAIGGFYAVAENYPDLKASSNFAALQADLADLENKISASRRFLNLSVAEYNAAREQFPAALVSKPMGFKEEPMYAIPVDRASIERAAAVGF